MTGSIIDSRLLRTDRAGGGSVRPASRYGVALTPLDRIDQGSQPVGDIQRRRLSGQDVIAQRPQGYRQVAD